MIIDYSAWRPAEQRWDVAVVGAGAAGISLAVSLAKRGRRVVLLESGGAKLAAATQDLYRGSVTNEAHHAPLHQYRKRVFGGTTTVWGGRCSPFDAIDFEERPYIDGSGWPITLEDLLPYYRQAHQYCDLGDYEYRAAQATGGSGADLLPGLQSADVLQDRIWRFSLPTNFGKKYASWLRKSAQVTVVTHANVSHIQLDESGRRVKHLLARSLAGAGAAQHVVADAYALAAGGLESTRLLLNSDDVQPNGIGNDQDLVGRYYGSHLSGDFGTVRFVDPHGKVKWRYVKLPDGVYYKQQLRISEEKQRALGLLNMRCILTHPRFGDPAHGRGVLSGAYLVKRFLTGQIPPEYSQDLASKEMVNVIAHMRNVVVDSPNVVGFGLDWISRRTLAKRKLPSIALRSDSGEYTMHFDAEQSPCRQSRVTLAHDTDALGMRRLKVDWKMNPEDVERLMAGYQLIGETLADSAVNATWSGLDGLRGKLLDGLGVGSHHLGTTRMSASPADGVVNAHCQIHGVDNLFVAGPSVFRTGSFANPVLTIVAFALRLADRLATATP